MTRLSMTLRPLALLAALALGGGLAAAPAAATTEPDSTFDVDYRSGTSDRADNLESTPGELAPVADGDASAQGTLLITQPGGSPVPVTDGGAQFYSADPPYELVSTAFTDPNGDFSISDLPPGDYNIAFFSRTDVALPVREWFNNNGSDNQPLRINAQTLALDANVTTDFETTVLGSRTINDDRFSGPDRFATAVSLSESRFTNSSGPTVIIVNGFTFPDALSGGALAASSGVLLMVEQNAIPSATQAELTRLDPSRIVIIGGTGVVSNAVQAALVAFVDDDASRVDRIAGADRYDTSRQVLTSDDGFASSVDALFIATGRGFPDALSAVPATAMADGALLLVDGSVGSLDPATRDLIDALNVPVYIIGGTGSVSAAIGSQLVTIAPEVTRVAGADRFLTSVEVALQFFPAADYAYLANAFSFPDALAAGPIAGQFDSPIYLSQFDCVPEAVVEDIFDVLANEVRVVGGTGVLSANVQSGEVCP
ncbi:cell wall-binding repeat-containing protein [Microcella sp.]|uniref:cell wall-binding repeat-containing protein n=1 Tax=Microcella sp. TaxID=1913979 RepID=UPI00255E3355|nr:cell wall-binding repeat-containing protein [Microcella sp.]MBX9472752.1 cell wall-binding repeat-containing protein [Microcella sp.]